MIKKLKDRIDTSKGKTSSGDIVGEKDIMRNQIVIMESLVYLIDIIESNKFDYDRKRKK